MLKLRRKDAHCTVSMRNSTGSPLFSDFKSDLSHSRPQSPRSFWPVAGIESSGLVQHRKSAIHGLIVKSSKSDWLRIRNEYFAHAQKIGSRQSSRSLPQARRIVGSGDENGSFQGRSFPTAGQRERRPWVRGWTTL